MACGMLLAGVTFVYDLPALELSSSIYPSLRPYSTLPF